ncbi:MAG: hypothetical protein P4M08_00795 [Oligoflexia bacterium]|nr:hypothetical protein [Oligoflexia bacterium]
MFAAQADDSARDWNSVQSLARSGKAEEAYQLLLKRPQTNATDYYNLGTLALQAGHVGPSIAYLEKANFLKHHDPDFLHNLELARGALSKTIGAEQLDPSSTWSEKLADHVSLEELRGVLGLLALAVCLLWTRVYLRTRDFRKCLVDAGSLLGVLTLALAMGLYFAEIAASARPPVVLLTHTSVRSGPGNDFSELSAIDAGVKLRMLGSAKASSQSEPALPGAPSLLGSPGGSGDASAGSSAAAGGPSEIWFQVRYSAEEIGWIPASSVLVID